MLGPHSFKAYSRLVLFGLVGFVLLAASTEAQRPAVDASRPDLSDIARALALDGRLRLENLFLDQLGTVQLELERFRVFAEDARIGGEGRWRPAPANAYLRGAVEGLPGSLAVLSFRERGGIGGWIRIDGDFWQVTGRKGLAGLASVKIDPDALPGRAPFDCLADSLPGSQGVRVSSGSLDSLTPAEPLGASYSYSARVAVETDWEFLDLFGGDEAAATDYVGDLFAFGSSIYEAEIDTSLYVSFLRLWPGTAEDDPWAAGDCTNQLYELRDYWRDNHDGTERAIAHMLSGKSTGCGIAYVGVLCSNTFGYGVSASLNGDFDPANPIPAVWDIIVVTHEIGHNFNSPHTHCYNGLPDGSYPDPVDPCSTATGCYQGTTDLPEGCPGSGQACGTIMSYCHLRSGGYGNIALTLGGSVLDGSSHLYGIFPERVPERMHGYVVDQAATGCLDPVSLGPTLSVAKSGNGAGTVTSDDGAINCGGDCSETYPEGSSPTVQLSATPDTGSGFSGWSGDPDCADGQVTVSADSSCTATFTLDTHTLTVSKAGTGAGTVTSAPVGIDCGADCSEDYDFGTVVTLTATPDAGSNFTGWSGDADCTDGSVTIDAARSCTATFDLAPTPTHTLTIARAGTGGGTVTSTPAGIDCGADCSEDYDEGTVVALTATPDVGSTFAGWSGDADCADGSVTMDAARSCTATFTLETRVLTVSKAGNGTGTVTSTPAGIDCGADCSQDYDYGTVVTLSATPGTGSTFAGWSGDADCADGSVTMDAARNCTATFTLDTHTLTVSKAGTGGGTVTSTPAGIDCGADCSQDYDHGTVVTLTATPGAGSTFAGWSGDADCTDGSVTMDAAQSCTATFTLDTHTLAVSKAGTGSGTVTSTPAGIDCGADCSQDYDHGTVVTLTATPDTGSTFAGWSGDGDCSDGSVTMDAARSCTATFTLDPHTLTVSKAGTGAGTVTSTPAGIDCGADCSQDYNHGTVVTLGATPDAGSIFIGWSGDADCADGSVTMTAATSCTATFDLEPTATHSLTVTKSGAGTGTVTSTPAGIDCGADCSQDYDEGTVVTLGATPDVGSAFAGWSGDADCSDGSVTMDAARSCTATFTLETRTLTVATSGVGSGTVTSTPSGIDCGADCTQDYDYGTVVTLTATPDADSTFAGWSGDADCADGSVTMDAATSCTATFALTTHTLAISKTGAGTGTVTSSPAGIDCGADCTQDYDEGTPVTLTATADTGSAFIGWSGDADCADGSVTMTAARSCTATFETTKTLAMTKTGTGGGTVTTSPAGLDCGTVCQASFPQGTDVQLLATPDPGSVFVGWDGEQDCGDGQVRMNKDRACSAIFDLEPTPLHSLTVSKTGTGTGTVTSTPAGIDCGADCSQDYDEGTVVTLTAVADTGSTFAGWSGDADCTDGSVSMTAATTCTATFTLETHTLTVAKAGTGGGTVTSTPAGIDCGADCSQDYDYGTVVTLGATPEVGSTFAGWSGDGDCTDGSVSMTAARNCTATFTLDTHTLTVSKAGTGTGTVTSTPAGIDCGADCSEDYDHGAVVTLSAAADPGSTFTGWSGDADCADGSVTMDAARNCTATFTLETHTLTVGKAGTGGGTVTSTPAGIDCGTDCSQDYDYGTVVTLTPAADAGSDFIGWSGDADCTDGSVTMTTAATCTATFDLEPTPTHTLAVTKSGTGTGTVTSTPTGIDCGTDCSQDYDEGTVVTLTAVADTGSDFAGWSGDADCTDGSVSMTAARNCTATFTLETHTLTVAKAGTGTGTVTSTPAGIDCGADCSQDYDYGTVVTLTPAADAGSDFAGWSGDADCADGSVSMTAATSCTATFTLETHTLMVATTGTGAGTVTSTPAGIDCGADCSQDYDYGTVVTLAATAEVGSDFIGWSGDADCSDGSVTLTAGTTCTATFALETHSLAVTKAGTGTGTVTSTPAGIDCGADCSQDYDYGTVVTLTPAADAGSDFAGWSGDADCTDGSVTMTTAATCTATFDLEPTPTHTLTVTRSGTGTGTVTSTPAGIDCGADCSQDYDENTVVTLSATPDTGSTFAGWSGDADCSDGSVTMTTATTCTAAFTLETHTLTVAKAGTGAGTVTSSPAGIDCGADCSQDYDYGTTVALSATPDTGSTFAGWSGDSDCADGSVNTTAATNCTATFTLETHTLTIAKTGTGTGTVTSTPAGIGCGTDCAEDYDEGSVVTLTAVADTGSAFAGWSGDADCSDGSVTMDTAHSCTATFDSTKELTMTKAGTGGGTVTTAPAGIDCGATCQASFPKGSDVQLVAVADSDSVFVSWDGEQDCTDGQVRMSKDRACTAIFEQLPPTTHALAVAMAGAGTGTGTIISSPAGIDCGADCTEDYDEGTVVALTATPDVDSTFVGWSGDADCADGSVTMDTARSCTATFDLLPPATHSLTVTKSGSGFGGVISVPSGIDCGTDCSESYLEGTSVSLRARRSTGSTFEGWSGACSGTQPHASVTMVADLQCNAQFDACTEMKDISGRSISEPEYFEACRQLLASDVSVEKSALTVTLVAGETVLFGNGFEVQDGAVLEVVIDPTLEP
jgi:hypothetical protein